MSTASTLLQLQGICVSYGPVEAVHEVGIALVVVRGSLGQ